MGKGRKPPRIAQVEPSPDESGDDTPPEKKPEEASGEERKRGGWAGDLSKRFVGSNGNHVACPPLLKVFRMVFKGEFTEQDVADPSVSAVRQLKLEDNARFLAELGKHEKDYKDEKAKKRAEVAKRREQEAATPNAAIDSSSDDTLKLIDELIADAELAAAA